MNEADVKHEYALSELLVCLAEEAAEVTQCSTKILRFGLDHFWAKECMTNKEALIMEMGDVLALIQRITKNPAAGIAMEDVLKACNAKHERLEKFLKHA